MQEEIAEVKDNANEIQDKENRRNNIILYKVEESKADTAEERNFEDLKFSSGVFAAINSGVEREDVKKVIRLGKRGDDNDAPRPLLVQFTSYLPKNLIMENLNKLKNVDAKYNKIIVSHDMTKKERENCRAMVAEAKTKTTADTSGEWVYLVRGPPTSPSQLRILKVKRTY